jgi:hypothetical protein
MTNAYGNLGASIGVALHDWLNNQMRKAAEKRAFEAAVKQRLEQQRLEAERQHRVEEARRLDAMINYLQGHLKLEGTPHLELKLGDTAQTGYGICGLPGEATGGQRPGCPQQETPGLGLKLGDQAASPTVYSKTPDPVGTNSNAASADEIHRLAANLTPEQAAEIFSKLPPAQQQAILDRFAQQNSLSNEQQAAAPPARDSEPAENGRLALKIGASGGASTSNVGTPSSSQTAEARAHVSDEHSGGVLPGRQQPATQYSAPSSPETTTAATQQPASSDGKATSAIPDKGLASQQLNAISAQRPEGSSEAQSEKARLGFDTATTWGKGQTPDGAPLNGSTPVVPPQTSQGVTAPPPLARATTGATSNVQAAPINTNPIPSGPLVALGGGATSAEVSNPTKASPQGNVVPGPAATVVGGDSGIGTAGNRIVTRSENCPKTTVLQPKNDETPPEVIAQRRATAQSFYEAQGWSEAKIADHMCGIDFSKPVYVVTLEPGTTVEQWQPPGKPQGNYYTLPGTDPGTLGIDPGRVRQLYQVKERVQVLQSTAADVEARDGSGNIYRGGGTQFFTTQAGSLAPK